MDLIIFFFN